MSNTRFKYDDCRIKKELQQSTDQGRWVLNVPGNGSSPCYMEDPQIIMQKWGANLRTNVVDLEGELRGVNRSINNRDCLEKTIMKSIMFPVAQLNTLLVATLSPTNRERPILRGGIGTWNNQTLNFFH